MSDANPFLAGLLGRCPRCGEGPLFKSYLKVAERCSACDLDFSDEDSGDGPAVFVMSIVGFIVVPAALVLEVTVTPPMWLHMVLWLPIATLITLALLPPFKATLFALQYKHNAHEAQLDLGSSVAEPQPQAAPDSKPSDSDAA